MFNHLQRQMLNAKHKENQNRNTQLRNMTMPRLHAEYELNFDRMMQFAINQNSTTMLTNSHFFTQADIRLTLRRDHIKATTT